MCSSFQLKISLTLSKRNNLSSSNRLNRTDWQGVADSTEIGSLHDQFFGISLKKSFLNTVTIVSWSSFEIDDRERSNDIEKRFFFNEKLQKMKAKIFRFQSHCLSENALEQEEGK